MSTIQGSTAAPRARGWDARLALSLFFITMVMEIVSLSYAKVATALPQIMTTFHTTQSGWLLTSSLLVGAVSSPLLGKLADLYGKRRVLLATIAVGWIGSILAAIAPTFGLLIAGRALQGALIPCMFLSYSLIRDVYPPRTVPFAVSIATAGLGVASVPVPFLNGWLIDTWGWRSIFWFDVLWLTVMAPAIYLTTPETPLRKKSRLDLLGFLLLGGGAAGVLVGVSFGQQWGWSSGSTLGFIGAGLALLAAWWLSARRMSEPLIDISLISRRPILGAAVGSGITYGVTVLSSTMLPLLAEIPRLAGGDYGLGFSPFRFAEIGAPNAAALVVGGILTGFLMRRISPRITMATGLLIQAVGALFLAFWHSTAPELIILACVVGLGSGLGYASTPNMVIANTPAHEQASTSSVVQICQTGLSACMPVALFVILAANVRAVFAGTPIYSGTGYQDGWFLMTGLALFGSLLLVTVFRTRSEPVVEESLVAATAVATAAEGAGTAQ
ncbi:MFS transporter [Trebonia kvetii]|uniref:MFS transporter n=1 Tax=Trebonia kvetii TaxID=2480626 RepID=A0A6P2BYC6_9ACTN|nr:MFS transporter [Trebonia kvetii]TVZ02193.1 MFS transporter [Trebonia kvetii]